MPQHQTIKRAAQPMTLAIAVPSFNEEDALPETAQVLALICDALQQQGTISTASRIVFIDDGSTDTTWDVICALSQQSERFSGIRLSRNFGHQNALICGLSRINADAIVTIDADLQDDANAITAMVQSCRDGADIVLGVRADRHCDGIFKRLSATSYYHFLRLLGVNAVYNHADFRLMSRRAVEALRDFDEVNLFLRGIIPLLGFKTRIVSYDRGPRRQGVSKYPLPKMLALALEGVTSFSVRPLRWITKIGFTLCALSIAAGLWAIAVRLLGGHFSPGWASTVIPLYFLGGLQLLGLGIVGEYLGKIYLETKHRPRFIIADTTGQLPQR